MNQLRQWLATRCTMLDIYTPGTLSRKPTKASLPGQRQSTTCGCDREANTVSPHLAHITVLYLPVPIHSLVHLSTCVDSTQSQAGARQQPLETFAAACRTCTVRGCCVKCASAPATNMGKRGRPELTLASRKATVGSSTARSGCKCIVPAGSPQRERYTACHNDSYLCTCIGYMIKVSVHLEGASAQMLLGNR